MLNKNEIINIIKELNLKNEDYYVGSGSALVLHGIKEFTNDVDLAVSDNLWNLYVKNGFLPNSNNENLMEISNNVEFIKNWYVDEVVKIENFPVASLDSLIKQKRNLGREKDFRDIILIENFIKNQ